MRQIIDFFLNGTENTGHKTTVRWMWRVFLGGIAAIVLLFIGLSFSNLPSVKQLENPKSDLATQIYAENGEVLGRLFVQNRVPVQFDDLDRNLVNALVATEDERYYQHIGIDFRSLGRAVIKTALLGDSSSGGASTITQQLAKLLFTEKPGSGFERIVQKLKEWIIAVRLERKYTKNEIIAMYLNKFDFIHDAYGIKAAAETYFGKPQDSLSMEEAAMLVGMLKNPYLYNPVSFPENAKKRREVVFKQMQRNNLLTQAEYDSLRLLPLGLNFNRRTHIDGIATYFRMEVAKDVKKILNNPEYFKSEDTPYDIYRDGLKIYTSIDPEIQTLAEEVMVKHMAKLQKQLWKEWGKLDPWSPRTTSDTEIPAQLRQESLQKLIRSTDRYQSLRRKYLLESVNMVSKEVPDLIFHDDDREVERIVQESETPGYLQDLRQNNIINEGLESAYLKVLRSPNFPALRKTWSQLQTATKEVFNRPAKMKVFTYENKRFEKDTTLSPLDSIKYHRMFLQIGSLVVDPKTGKVKAWVGGINHKYFQFDHIRSSRQVGSTFKPFIYATAIDQLKISPCLQVYDWPQTIKPGDGNFFLLEEWTPQNFNGKYTNQLFTLFEGLRKSKNTVSVYLMKELGDTEPVRNLVHNMGIDTSIRYPNGRYRVPKVPSICLGATDLTVMEMTGAYTTFANNGIRNSPIYITRIEDKSGRLIYEDLPQGFRALPENSNFVMVEMLRQAGALNSRFTIDVGGKTGTTNDFVDGWFMGITPEFVIGTWIGGEDRWIHFRYPSTGQGSYMAKPFFVELMTAMEKSDKIVYDKTAKFYRPPGDLGIELDCSQYRTDDLDIEGDFDTDEFKEDIFGDQINSEDPFGNNDQ